MLMLADSKTGKKAIYLNPPSLEVLRNLRRLAANPFVVFGGRVGRHLINLEKPWRRLLIGDHYSASTQCSLRNLRASGRQVLELLGGRASEGPLRPEPWQLRSQSRARQLRHQCYDRIH